MSQYKLPQTAITALEESLQSKKQAKILAGSFEDFLQQVDKKAETMTVEKLAHIRLQLKDDLCGSLMTRKIFEERCSMLVTNNVFKERCDLLVTKEVFEKRCDLLVTKEAFEKQCNLLVTKEVFEKRCDSLVTKDVFKERFTGLRNEMNAKFETVHAKFDVKFDSLRNEMAEKFLSVDIRFKSLNLKLTILIVLTLAALTFANPSFVALLKALR